MSQATPDVCRNPAVVITLKGRKHCSAADIAALAADDARRRKLIGREIEELLRIRREAGEAAHRLIRFLDLDEIDADYEPSLGWYGETGDDREGDPADDEPSIGWSLTVNQASPGFLGPQTFYEAEAEHDGREPDADLEPDADDEPGSDDDVSDADRNPAYFARLKARRRAKAAHVRDLPKAVPL